MTYIHSQTIYKIIPRVYYIHYYEYEYRES